MAELKTFPVPAQGGLDLVSPTQVLAQKPGFAVELNNMEPLPEGGYRRIKGYVRYGDVPDGYATSEVRGITVYHGIVVVIGDVVLHSPTGATFFPVNGKDVTAIPSKDLWEKTKVPREGTGRVQFTKMNVDGKDKLIITDSKSVPAILTVDGDTYTYELAGDGDTALEGYLYATKYQDHVVIAGGAAHPGDVAVSARFNPKDFKGTGSWSFKVPDQITGIHTFRDFLYVFCKSSIYRVSNLESSQNAVVRPVTTKIGCVNGETIQEIGGDIMFLAADGLRYLGATERIDDVSLTTVSGLIRPLIDSIDFNTGYISSVVIPSKAQYRLYYRNKQGRALGIIGVLSPNGSFQWSTTSDMNVIDVASETIGGIEYVYHIGAPRIGAMRVYRHDVGDTFDGTPYKAGWRTPYTSMGDGAIRKCMHSMEIYLEAKDTASIQVRLSFDHENPNTAQPEPFLLAQVVEAARFGTAVYGKSLYGATRFPIDVLFLEGSGDWVQFIFEDAANTNSEYVVRGFDLQFTSGGRI